MHIFDRQQTTFEHYFAMYREHYDRRLTAQDTTANGTNYLYKRCSESKRTSYRYWNEWLKARWSGNTCDETFTVLCGNCQSYSLGAIYTRGGKKDLVYIFIVITPQHIYEWYVEDDDLYATYLGPVPAHRTQCHLTSKYIAFDEDQLDRTYKYNTLMGVTL